MSSVSRNSRISTRSKFTDLLELVDFTEFLRLLVLFSVARSADSKPYKLLEYFTNLYQPCVGEKSEIKAAFGKRGTAGRSEHEIASSTKFDIF